MQAKKSLGQNFLKEDTIIQKIVSLLNATKEDLVIEIGPGRGALTKYLSKIDTNIVCIEIDTDMKNILNKYESNHLKVIYDDILKTDLLSILSNYKYNKLFIIGNLPYYITSPIIEHLINSNINANSMIFMVQDEVAKRFSASNGNKEYGYMTAFLNNYYDVNYEIFVPRKCFDPVPKVDSAVIKLTLNNSEKMPNTYYNFLKDCFKLKRKTLKNNLKNYDWPVVEEILKNNGFDVNVRAEQLSNDMLKKIYKGLHM